MELSYNQQKELYEEMMNINEENVKGKFFVSSEKELKMKAIEYLVDEKEYDQEDIKDIKFEIRWKGAGLYSFWGLDFINKHVLAHITEIFEAETNVHPLIFLGDEKAIENERRKWYERDNFVYAIWNQRFELVDTIYTDDKDDDEIFELRKKGYLISELRDMDHDDFYDFLKQNAAFEWLL